MVKIVLFFLPPAAPFLSKQYILNFCIFITLTISSYFNHISATTRDELAVIANQNFALDPDIILVDGTEIGAAKLYREGEKKVNSIELELRQLQEDVSKIKAAKLILSKKVETQRKEVEELLDSSELQKQLVIILKQTTEKQRKSLIERTEQLNKILSMLEEKENTLRRKTQIILQQQDRIGKNQENIDNLLITSAMQKLNIEKQLINLEERKYQLLKLKSEILRRRETLDTQAVKIKNQTTQIKKQIAAINDQKETIAAQHIGLQARSKVISSQQNYLLLISLSTGLVTLLALLTYRGARKNRETNKQLIEQKLLLESATVSLKQAKETAVRANNAKSIFLATMSHELRTPLNAVLGFSEIMTLDPEISTKQRCNLDIIHRSGKHLLSMINKVLDLSKIEFGKVELEIKPIDLVQTIVDVTDMIRIRAIRQTLNFNVRLDESLPKFVKLDDGKLRQVLLNLLGNAIKYTSAGSVSLHVLQHKLYDTLSVTFKISDTGCGIATDHLENIFEPFVQVGRTSYQQSGSGLGLAISQQLVQLMGGKITANSIKGSGSSFQFSLLMKEVDRATFLPAIKNRTVVGLTPGQKQWRILIIEDQIENRLLLRNILESVGFHVREATNGASAVKLFEQWQPNLIWIGLKMPTMEDFEATQRIRLLPNGKSVAIIALTAGAFKNDIPEIFAAGCDEVLHKPYQVQDIYRTMSNHLDIKFRYEEDVFVKNKLVEKPTIEKLALLEIPFLTKLHLAATHLDQDQIIKLLLQIKLEHPKLYNGLMDLSHNFRFDILIDLCKNAIDQTTEFAQ